jgi:hypothetical protein
MFSTMADLANSFLMLFTLAPHPTSNVVTAKPEEHEFTQILYKNMSEFYLHVVWFWMWGWAA